MLLCYLVILTTAVAVTFGLPSHRHNHRSRDVPHTEIPKSEDNKSVNQDSKSRNKQTPQSENEGQTTTNHPESATTTYSNDVQYKARKFLGQLDRLKKEVKDEAGLENFKAKLKSLSVNVRQLEDQQFKQRDNKPQVRRSNNYLQIQLFKSDFGEIAPRPGEPMHEWKLNKNVAEYMYEIDIVLLPSQLDQLITNECPRRKATNDPQAKWPTSAQGIIPYSFDSSIVAATQIIINEAVSFWQSNTCLKFALNGAGTNSIQFFKGDGCYSYIGMQGGQQQISIGDGCGYVGIATHEIAHALAFYHEQSRYDRSTSITINLGNVQAGMESNFDLVSSAYMNLYGIPYDLGSVMHYSSDSFANNMDIPTIISIDPLYQQTMGQRKGPSFYDVLEMNRHYGCVDLCNTSTTACLNGGYPDPLNCNQCKCPSGFGGTFCDQLQAAENPQTGVACGGVLQASTSFLTLTATVGTESTTDDPTTCYWHLTSPQNTVIEMQLTSINGACSAGCFWNSLEVKTSSDFKKTGYRHCCQADILHKSYTSQTNLVPVIAYGDYTIQFSIQYRYTTLATNPTSSSITASVTTINATQVTTTDSEAATTTTVPTTTKVATTTTTVPSTTTTAQATTTETTTTATAPTTKTTATTKQATTTTNFKSRTSKTATTTRATAKPTTRKKTTTKPHPTCGSAMCPCLWWSDSPERWSKCKHKPGRISIKTQTRQCLTKASNGCPCQEDELLTQAC